MGWGFFAGTYLAGMLGAILLCIKNGAPVSSANLGLCICWPVLLVYLIADIRDGK